MTDGVLAKHEEGYKEHREPLYVEMSVNKGPQERDFTPRHIGALCAFEEGSEINWLNGMSSSERRPSPKHTCGHVERLWQARIIVLEFKVKGPSIKLKGRKGHFMDIARSTDHRTNQKRR